VILLTLIGILLLALAAGLMARALVLPRLRTSSQVRQIETYGFKAHEGGLGAASVGGSARLRQRLDALAERIGRVVAGPGWRTPVESRKLRAAGLYSVTPEAFHGYRVLLALGVPGLLVFLSVASHSVTATRVLEVIFAAALCWFGPALLVGTRSQRRMDKIDRALPELIDVLTATIEAGLGFAGSLQMVAPRFSGPLGQELRLTLQEQGMGLSSDVALSHLLDRCDTPSMRAFVRAVLQGESLGVSIATMMRNLATETRKRRRQAAQARIQRAPVKMLFPLVFLVFPSLLIVLLYPAFTTLTEQLGGH
jgi:pilus assembly protein TadC